MVILGRRTVLTMPSPPGITAPDDERAEEEPVSVLELLGPDAELDPGN